MMKSIEFTQFLFPTGKRHTTRIDRPQEIYDKAKQLKDRGFSLEIENKDGQIWMSCVNHSTDEATDEMCKNDWQVIGAIDRLITEAAKRYL